MFSKIKILNKQNRYGMAGKHNFEKLDLRYGKIVEVTNSVLLGDAAYTLTIDFGSVIGRKKTTLRITKAFAASELRDKYVIGIVNFAAEKTKDMHEIDVWLLGAPNDVEDEVFVTTEAYVPLGEKVYLIE